jgi:hypothetical protein
MHRTDKTLDDARDRMATPRLPRSLAFGLMLIVLGTGAAYYWNQFALSLTHGKKGKPAPTAPAVVAPAVPAHGHPTGQ